MLVVLESVLAGWLLLGVPVAGRRRYRRLQEQLRADPRRLLRFYRRSVVRQWLVTAVAGGLLVARGTTARAAGVAPTVRRLGPLAPALATVIVVGALMVVVLRAQRRRHPDDPLAERLLRPARWLLPRRPAERRGFAAVALTAGVTEELLYRGFLVVWLQTVAGLGFHPALVVSSLGFGAAHAYQGPVGVAGTTLAGFAFAYLYSTTGSLFVPMVLHALVDLRVLLLVRVTEDDGQVRAVNATDSSP